MPKWSRSAEPKPRAEPTRRRGDEHTGTLVLIGGACDPHGEALGAFVRLSGALDGGKIVGLTTASRDPHRSALEWTNTFALAGARNVEFPIVDRRDRAQDRRIAELVMEANGVFLGGGDQVALLATLAGSRVGHAVRDAFHNGAVVCGTSAGAAALSETVLAGDEIDEEGDAAALFLGPGLGLLDYSSVIDTHFSKRGRLQRLFKRVAENPELLGLGIDEDTALVVRGCLAEVVGKGALYYVDGRGVCFDNAEDVEKRGVPLTLSYLRVGVVGAGYTFNLRERELELLVERRAAAEPTPRVTGDGVP